MRCLVLPFLPIRRARGIWRSSSESGLETVTGTGGTSSVCTCSTVVGRREYVYIIGGAEVEGTRVGGGIGAGGGIGRRRNSPSSRGTASESSGGPTSPLNQSTGMYMNNQLGMSNISWK
ncbi:hypothetical protein KSP39_PZI018001 [Platanthera zijinensis]|uniref:Uncharacterized protein n=1 Tax=Platanthera zijinensis TaxID=2320716 RepID=A0AAP0FZD9_9ASPA